MNEDKRQRLEQRGWRVSTVQAFLGLSDDEMSAIEAEITASRQSIPSDRFMAKVLSRPGAREHIDALHAELLAAPVNLWLDDLRPAPDASWRHVKTAQEAIDWLQRSFFDVVSLDHDLGPPEAGTGYDVLTWLERAVAEGDWCTEVPELRIHSANPVGRANMARAIESIRRLAKQMLG